MPEPGATSLIDTHCHLDPQYFPSGPDEVLARAEAVGIRGFVVIGVGRDLAPARAAVALAKRLPDRIGSAVGVHPHDAVTLDDAAYAELAALAKSTSGADATWAAFVVDLGVQSASASSRATVAEAARSTASAAQLAQTSVDTDEETVNMLAFQRAYEGAARVLTAVDEMLDTLINRTGVVGR